MCWLWLSWKNMYIYFDNFFSFFFFRFVIGCLEVRKNISLFWTIVFSPFDKHHFFFKYRLTYWSIFVGWFFFIWIFTSVCIMVRQSLFFFLYLFFFVLWVNKTCISSRKQFFNPNLIAYFFCSSTFFLLLLLLLLLSSHLRRMIIAQHGDDLYHQLMNCTASDGCPSEITLGGPSIHCLRGSP